MNKNVIVCCFVTLPTTGHFSETCSLRADVSNFLASRAIKEIGDVCTQPTKHVAKLVIDVGSNIIVPKPLENKKT